MNTFLDFLPCETPITWIEAAISNQPLLLIDHANCEKKAAATAMNLMYRHTTKLELLNKMSQLAREELLHFQQVVQVMTERDIEYVRLVAIDLAGNRSAVSEYAEPKGCSAVGLGGVGWLGLGVLPVLFGRRRG